MWGRQVFNFIRKGSKISNVGARFHIQLATCEMQLLYTLVILFHFIFSGGCEGFPSVAFICISLMTVLITFVTPPLFVAFPISSLLMLRVC